MSAIELSQCYRIQKSLMKGQCWTRLHWINHPDFHERRPRLMVVRNYDAQREVARPQDQFKQVWDGRPGEPLLNMISYRPSQEDYEAMDWLCVNIEGLVQYDFYSAERFGDLD